MKPSNFPYKTGRYIEPFDYGTGIVSISSIGDILIALTTPNWVVSGWLTALAWNTTAYSPMQEIDADTDSFGIYIDGNPHYYYGNIYGSPGLCWKPYQCAPIRLKPLERLEVKCNSIILSRNYKARLIGFWTFDDANAMQYSREAINAKAKV